MCWAASAAKAFEPASGMSGSTDPIFLLCSERSGSNLITRIFDNHSRFRAPPTTHILRILGENLFRYGDIREPRNWSVLVDDFIALFDAKLGSWSLGSAEVERIARRAVPGSLGELFLALYRAETDAAGKESFFVKENQFYNFAPVILDTCPNARFLYLVRDPRDMALSWLTSAALRGGPVRAARVWNTDQQGFVMLASQLAATRRVACLKYESLIDDPGGALRRVCRDLDVAFEEEMLAFHCKESVIADAAKVADWGNTSKPLMMGNSGKYRSGLRPDQIAFIEATCADLMRVFGYHPSLEPPQDLTALTERLTAEEPFEKAAYQKVAEDERALRERWQAVVATVRSRILDSGVAGGSRESLSA